MVFETTKSEGNSSAFKENSVNSQGASSGESCKNPE